MVSARSVRIGPKLGVDLTNVPVLASKRYVKPDAGDGSGSDVSWLASAMLNCVKFDWNAPLKWAECVEPSGSTESLFTVRPFGPNRFRNTVASVVVRVWAAAGAETPTSARSRRAVRRMDGVPLA